MTCRALDVGDRLVVSESSSLGWSISRVIRIVDKLVKQKIRFEGEQDSAIWAVP